MHVHFICSGSWCEKWILEETTFPYISADEEYGAHPVGFDVKYNFI